MRYIVLGDFNKKEYLKGKSTNINSIVTNMNFYDTYLSGVRNKLEEYDILDYSYKTEQEKLDHIQKIFCKSLNCTYIKGFWYYYHFFVNRDFLRHREFSLFKEHLKWTYITAYFLREDDDLYIKDIYNRYKNNNDGIIGDQFFEQLVDFKSDKLISLKKNRDIVFKDKISESYSQNFSELQIVDPTRVELPQIDSFDTVIHFNYTTKGILNEHHVSLIHSKNTFITANYFDSFKVIIDKVILEQGSVTYSKISSSYPKLHIKNLILKDNLYIEGYVEIDNIDITQANKHLQIQEMNEGFHGNIKNIIGDPNKISIDDSILKIIDYKKPEEAKNFSIEGLRFSITGSLEKFKNRKQLVDLIEKNKGIFVSKVDTSTNYLINNDKDSSSTKNKKAAILGVAVITEKEFLNKIGFKEK